MTQLRLWAAVAVVVMVLAAACGSGSDAENVERSPTLRELPEPTTEIEVEANAKASRWGYNPGRATGQVDEPPVFMDLPADYKVETVATGLDLPTSLAFTPDGRLLVTEQTGAVRVIEDGELLDEPFYTVNAYKDLTLELGLTGIAVDPDFEEDGYVYLYYTTDEPVRRTVLARVRDEDGIGVDEQDIVSLEMASNCCHVAGGLEFADDGTLFVSIGDHQKAEAAQDRDILGGSILRITREGEAPPDNPFVGGDGDPRIYAYGLRNPFGITFERERGRLFSTENGWIGQDAILEIVAGGNYGWPGRDLDVPIQEVVEPLVFFHEPTGPAGIEYYSRDGLPVLTDSLLFCQYHGQVLRALHFEADGSVVDDGIVSSGCSSGVETGPDGFIYFLDILNGTVFRLARNVSQ
jgi:glucose/arabinose dehydrogenase